MKFLPIVILFSLTFTLQAQSVFGKWKTIDDESGKPRSIVEIYEQNGKMYGRIEQLFREPDEEADPVCDECNDHRKDQKVIGMIIISEMIQDRDEWSGGEILDPENGKVYRCKIWVEGGTLKVRGYIAFFFRTQTWLSNQ